jgi:hypothetical protein
LFTFSLKEVKRMEMESPAKKKGTMMVRNIRIRKSQLLKVLNLLTSRGIQMMANRLRKADIPNKKAKTDIFFSVSLNDTNPGTRNKITPATPNPNKAVETIKKA